jgi:predicted amidohydrolase
MKSVDGNLDGNPAQATRLAEAAHAKDAQFNMFPEFMPTGYALDESI